MLSALQLLNVIKETGKPLSELASEMKVFPQVLKNVKVANKEEAMTNSRIQEEIEAVEKELGNEGRVLVRPSGTEPLIRVMVEAPTEEACENYTDRIVKVVEELFGVKE